MRPAICEDVTGGYATLALNSPKACTGPANPLLPGSCLTWSPPVTLLSDTSDPQALFGVTATYRDGKVFLAARAAAFGRRLRIWRCDVGPDGILSIVDQTDAHEHPTGLFPRDYRSDFAPELVTLHQTVHGRDLGLLYVDTAGSGTLRTYRHYGWNGSDWLHLGPLLDAGGQPLQGRVAPAAKAWPGGELVGWVESKKRTLAVLPDAEDKLRVYALVPSLDRWLHLTTMNLTQVSTGRPFLEYRAARKSDGKPTEEFRGHFLVGWPVDSVNDGLRANVLFTSVVSRTAPPSSGTTAQLWQSTLYGWLQNQWATQIPGTTAALYSDPALDNVFGPAPLDTGNAADTGLVFYPHADGSPDWPLTTYSDFRVMEDGICEGLTGDQAPYAPVCGDLNHMD